MAAQEFDARALNLVQRLGLHRGQEADRRVELAGLDGRLRRGQRALESQRWIDRERDGALQERRRSGDPTSGLRAAGRPLELGGDLFVGARGAGGAMPGPSVRVGLGVGGVGERTMDTVAVVLRRRAIGGRPDQGMRELDASAEREQSGVHGGVDGRDVDLEGLRDRVEQHGVAERLGRRGEDEELRVGREQLEPAHVALLDLPGDRRALRQTEPPGELRGVPRARELEERQRVAVALRDDLVADGRIHRTDQVLQQQCARIALAEPAHEELGEPGQDRVADPRPCGSNERHPLCEESACDEREDLRGGSVEPMRVVDDPDERPVLRRLGEQRQRREPDEEPVGRSPVVHPEDRLERVTLRERQPGEVIEQREAELVQAAVGELHLGLDPRGPNVVGPGTFDVIGQVAEQRGLAHAGLATKHEHPTPALAHINQEAIKRLTLGLPPEESHERPLPPPAGALSAAHPSLPMSRASAARGRATRESHGRDATIRT